MIQLIWPQLAWLLWNAQHLGLVRAKQGQKFAGKTWNATWFLLSVLMEALLLKCGGFFESFGGAQLVWVSVHGLLSITAIVAMHGKPTEGEYHEFSVYLLVTLLRAALLYWGGFFGALFSL